jgi:hypothetical protein
MASTFKTLLNDDVVNTRTLLHEAIPITGTIVSGATYQDKNVKTYTHGMFETTYDYPYLSSSANHIFDVSYGYCDITGGTMSASAHTQNAKKLNMYNQFAQVLMGYTPATDTASAAIRKFDSDGQLDDEANLMNSCFFLSFSRLLVKDEIKKGSFTLKMYSSGTVDDLANDGVALTLGDYDALNEYRTSPSGDYGLIFTASADAPSDAGGEGHVTKSVGLIFYQAGIVVLSSSFFHGSKTFGYSGSSTTVNWGDGTATGLGAPGTMDAMGGDPEGDGTTNAAHALHSGTIEDLAKGFRNRWIDCDFNNTIELNSTVYFARVNHNEYNYSSNPTFVSGSKLVVKNTIDDLPVSYITTVGLYSPDNELLAVAKLSEPLRKDPNTELTLRVRLDY